MLKNLAKSQILIFFFLISCSSEVYEPQEYVSTNLTAEKITLSNEILKKLKKDHYIKSLVDKRFNENYIKNLIDKLDENKFYFTQSEVNIFIAQSIAFKENDFDIDTAYAVINLYFKKLIDFSEYQIKMINKDTFDFTKNEFIDIYYDDNQWSMSDEELEESWRLQTKNDLLITMIADKLSVQPKADLIKRYKNRIRRIQQQKEEDIFSIAMNALANQFDPHSSYLSPRSAEDFDMNMSLKLEGIGALLGIEDDYTTIVSLVPGGPAEKSGRIEPEDRITRIRQKNSIDTKYIDVIGWRIDEVVDLIRGQAGTEVEIEFISAKSSDNERKIVTLKREEIKLEDRAAKSKIFTNNYGNKIGIIDLPSFYIDFNAYQKREDDYKSSSGDVKKILEKFNNENVEALVLDLRNNGGGALMEANKIIGLFVASGPTVQVKHKAGYIQPYGASRAKQVWEKPLVVLVNRYSASASEIVAGAIQDYQRGLVVGQRTFGKGTVQSLENLSQGQIKITESKYYRVNGTSTQNKGVIPDIELASTWDIETIGESSYPTALEWDTVKPYRYKKFNLDPNKVNDLKKHYLTRLKEEPNLIYLKDVRQRYDQNKSKKLLTLNFDERKSEKDIRRSWLLDIENKRRIALELMPFSSYEEFEKSNDEEIIDSSDSIDLDKDYLLIESLNIAKDFLNLDKKIILSKVN